MAGIFYLCLCFSQKPYLKYFIIYCCFLEMIGMELFPWNSPGQNTGVHSRSLLQAISPTWDRTQVSFIASRFLPAEPQGKPKNTGVDSLSLSSGSSPPRNSTRVSCIAGVFFTSCTTREALLRGKGILKNSTSRLLVRCEWDLKSGKVFPIQRV